MALGNANTSAQARGKNKATKIRKRKEVEAGASLTMFRSGIMRNTHSDACAVVDTNTNTFYHDGAAVIPVVNDIVYKEPRARGNNKFEAGFYQVAAGGKGSVSLQINSLGVCIARTNC